MRELRKRLSDQATLDRLFQMLAAGSGADSFDEQHAALEAADDLFGATAPQPEAEFVVSEGERRAVVRVPKSASSDDGSKASAPFTPNADELQVALVYFHGGGYCIGSPKSERGLSLRIAAALQLPTLVPEYRKAPAHPFPAALDDAVFWTLWVAEGNLARAISSRGKEATAVGPTAGSKASPSGVESPSGSNASPSGERPPSGGSDPGEAVVGETSTEKSTKVVLGGSSAGGGLGLAVALHLKERDPERFRCIAGIFAITGWFDVTNSSPSIYELEGLDPLLGPRRMEAFASAYAADTPRSHHLISPIFGDLAGLPPVRLDWAGRDSLRDDSRRLFERLEAEAVAVSGAEWEEMPHIFPYFEPVLREAREYFDEVLPAWANEAGIRTRGAA